MVLFDQLKISDNGGKMYLNFHVNKADYFRDIYLDSLTIMTADKVSETDPMTSTSEYIYKQDFTEDLKEYDVVIDKGVLDAASLNWDSVEKKAINPSKPYANTSFSISNFSSDLFFVYVKCRGIHGECTPCRLDELTTLGVTFDESLLHQKVMNYTQELADSCIVPQGFTDFILLWQAFNSAVETEHYIPAIKYWKMLFGRDAKDEPYGPYGGSGGYVGNKGGCGCHGKNRI